ncbi:ribonuclease P protein subunit p21 [Copidosoma floridanum]|uniref:ribonuclease P protein subunit p21 n=1 Tax=Copidosoma floridanum TaxID=29053 RepID=UPI0006C983E7|nr:ribonuclease P protein subunit p21 [Copidosoma floridanum]
MKSSSAINEKLCQGKDVFERINYLYQASQMVSSKNSSLASYYNSILVGCAKKSVLRLDHNLKRSICKTCQCPLIPGETAQVRLLGKKKKIMKTTCLACKSTKNIPTKGEQTLWSEQPEALLETFDYKPKLKKVNIDEDYASSDVKNLRLWETNLLEVVWQFYSKLLA